MIPTQEQIDKMNPAEEILTMETMKEMILDNEMEKTEFPIYFKQAQEEYSAYFKILSREAGIRVDVGITPLLHESEVKTTFNRYFEKQLVECPAEDFYNAQAVAQDRINKLLIK